VWCFHGTDRRVLMFWYVSSTCSPVEMYSRDGGSGVLCKVGKRFPDYTESNSRRQFLKFKMLRPLPLFPFVIRSVNDAASFAFLGAWCEYLIIAWILALIRKGVESVHCGLWEGLRQITSIFNKESCFKVTAAVSTGSRTGNFPHPLREVEGVRCFIGGGRFVLYLALECSLQCLIMFCSVGFLGFFFALRDFNP